MRTHTPSRPRIRALIVLVALSLALAMSAGRAPEAGAGQTSVRAQIERSLELAELQAPLPSLLNLASLDDDVWNRHFRCFVAYRATRAPICPLGATSARRTVVALGDSHVGQWLPALDTLGKRRGFKVIPLVKLSCSPYDVRMAILDVAREYTECIGFRRWARRMIARWRPGVVVLAARVLAAGSDKTTTLQERSADWKRGVASGVRRLLRNGAGSVKVLSDLPEVEQDPGECLRQPDATMASCLSSPGHRVTLGNHIVRDAARAGGAAYVNVMPLVCLRDLCPAVVGRVVTFRDDDHVTITWARAVAAEFGGRLGLR